MAVDSQNNSSGLFGGILGIGGGANQSIAAAANPYLNINTAHINDADEFIPLAGEEQQRGSFGQSISKVGGVVVVGASLGFTQGLYRGFNATKNVTGSVKRTQMLNYLSKNMSSHSATLGTLAVMYHGGAVLLGKARGQEDALNQVAAGAFTGFAYQLPSGLRRAGIGGAVGLALSGAWALYTSRVDESRFNSTLYYG